MKQAFIAFLLSGAILLVASCASVVNTITVESTPSDALITITDQKGVEVYNGNTPAEMSLDARSSWFSKASYQVKFEKKGYDIKTVPLEFRSDGWYYGKTQFGEIVALLIVDNATGEMFKLDKSFLNEALIITTARAEKEELRVFEMNEIPLEWKKHLLSLDR